MSCGNLKQLCFIIDNVYDEEVLFIFRKVYFYLPYFENCYYYQLYEMSEWNKNQSLEHNNITMMPMASEINFSRL